MSDNESPADETINAKERGTAAWLVACENFVQTEKGMKRIQYYARKYTRAGNDLEELAEELAELVGAEQETVLNFLTEAEDGSMLGSEMQAGNEQKTEFYEKLEAKINFLKGITFVYPENK